MIISFYEKLHSTQETAMSRLRRGESPPFAVVATTQTHGRGTAQRSWVSAPGGLYLSMVLPWTKSPLSNIQKSHEINEWPLWHITVASVLCDEIKSIAPQTRPYIKWPNDIIIGTKKVGGILMQLRQSTEGRGHDAIGIGIGLNLNQTEFPSQLAATSLWRETQECYNVKDVATQIIRAISSHYHDTH